jgi:hypothetical protein
MGVGATPAGPAGEHISRFVFAGVAVSVALVPVGWLAEHTGPPLATWSLAGLVLLAGGAPLWGGTAAEGGSPFGQGSAVPGRPVKS